jgi:hypothetical protein
MLVYLVGTVPNTFECDMLPMFTFYTKFLEICVTGYYRSVRYLSI